MVKALLISNFESHPVNSGRTTRLTNLVDHLNDHCNIECHLLVISDKEKMSDETKNYWGDRLFSLFTPKKISWKKHSLFDKIVARLKKWILRKYYQNIDVDTLYDQRLVPAIEKIQATYSFDIIISEYIFMSGYLKCFPESHKLIDTHDVFSNRFKIFSQQNIALPLESCSSTDERKALLRANAVIAIQNNDKDYFKKLTQGKVPVATVGYLYEHRQVNLNELQFNNTLLFFATATSWNISAYNTILTEILPKLKEQNIEFHTIVAGSITKHIIPKEEIEYIPYVENIQELYDRADLIINPTSFGTGLKIKSIEALKYNKLVVAHRHAFLGVEQVEQAVSLASNSKEMSQAIIELLSSVSTRDRLRAGIANFNQSYYQQNLNSLKKLTSTS
ncbi:MAG: glycosyltransferase [Reichenbachiella sp.]|uniref:glycosyltransferase n=1 Tax=Reichenbachiella sp. TaxID=2184521 RepID=UPI0029671C7D|nr:glycosyltransferase [Reichenbachiella sp.]MDW3211694.1 glycosyltransferase [Reichenbachiella sp.]